MLLNIGKRGDSWCGVCDKTAKVNTRGWCGGKPDQNYSFLTRVKEFKNWGFCSNKLCNLKTTDTNVLKETKLTVLPSKHCAVFTTISSQYNKNKELCAGKKVIYKKIPVYQRGKKSNGKYAYTYKGKTIYHVSIQFFFLLNRVKSFMKRHSCYFNLCYLYLVKTQKCSYRKNSTQLLSVFISNNNFNPF